MQHGGTFLMFAAYSSFKNIFRLGEKNIISQSSIRHWTICRISTKTEIHVNQRQMTERTKYKQCIVNMVSDTRKLCKKRSWTNVVLEVGFCQTKPRVNGRNRCYIAQQISSIQYSARVGSLFSVLRCFPSNCRHSAHVASTLEIKYGCFLSQYLSLWQLWGYDRKVWWG